MGLVNCTYAGRPSAAWGLPDDVLMVLRVMRLRTATCDSMAGSRSRVLTEAFEGLRGARVVKQQRCSADGRPARSVDVQTQAGWHEKFLRRYSLCIGHGSPLT